LRIDGIEGTIHAVIGDGGLGHGVASTCPARWHAGGEAILSDGVEESQFAVAVTLDVNTLGV